MTESELSELLSKLNRAVFKCANGNTTFEQFTEEYGYPVGEYALDGHEASGDERRLFAKWNEQIAPHVAIAEQILNKLCSREESTQPEYQAQGRIGPEAARQRLKEIVVTYAIKEAT